MSPIVAVLIKLAIRLVVFAGVFWIAAKKNSSVVFDKKWATPIVAFTFAVLNTALYWLLEPVLDLASLGVVGFAMPLIVNGALLALTVKIFASRKWFRIEGFLALMWMATFLTIAHGVLWFAVDYIPAKV